MGGGSILHILWSDAAKARHRGCSQPAGQPGYADEDAIRPRRLPEHQLAHTSGSDVYTRL